MGLSIISGCTDKFKLSSENENTNQFIIDTQNQNSSNPSLSGKEKQDHNVSFNQFQQMDLESTYTLAESYARQKYPAFWENSSTRTVKNQIKKETPHGWGNEYSFSWIEILYYPDIKSSGHYEINGPGKISIIMNNTGQIKHEYFIKSYNTSERSINLIPNITEERAWDAVLAYYKTHGVTNILPSEKMSQGLWIWDDSANDQNWPRYGKQYLAWVFFLEHRNHGDKYAMGGVIVVDAKDGRIVNIAEIV